MKTNRLLYPDLFRILSCFAVIVIHVSVSLSDAVHVQSYEWQVMNLYDSLARFCVPAFVMLSGMFFLRPDRELPLKKLYGKYILRIATAFLFWSVLYALIIETTNYTPFTLYLVKKILLRFVIGHYHMWFLYMLAGLYMITPFLRTIIAHTDKRMLEYFLLLCFIFAVFFRTLAILGFISTLNTVLSKMNMHFVLGYVGYYVAGYYLHTYTLSRWKKRLIYVLGILGAAGTVIFSSLMSVRDGATNGTLHHYLSPNVMFVAIALFLFFKDHVSKIKLSDRMAGIVTKLSSYTFGIYLAHAFFIYLFTSLGLTILTFDPAIAIPVISLAVFISSLIVTFGLSKIPVLNRYII